MNTDTTPASDDHSSVAASGAADALDSSLHLTARAAARVRKLVAEEGNPALKLRVFVTGGGCSGFQYGFTFDEIPADDDTMVESEGVTVLLDALSIQYLGQAQVDYHEGLTGAHFVVENPNASTTCGCGLSFAP